MEVPLALEAALALSIGTIRVVFVSVFNGDDRAGQRFATARTFTNAIPAPQSCPSSIVAFRSCS